MSRGLSLGWWNVFWKPLLICFALGQLGALMGSSGAGKTTLLDVLAQRKTDGTIRGSVLVDGRPLTVSFQRSAGYCEQLDVHEPLATVREALEFSALLRQSRTTPREEKLKYVDSIIDLLEMHDIENTLIGTTGAGLSVEQRKRLTIGVELVSKPSILIFLDEPTSGLDGQAAFNIVRFLRKLADVGQAVLVSGQIQKSRHTMTPNLLRQNADYNFLTLGNYPSTVCSAIPSVRQSPTIGPGRQDCLLWRYRP